MNKTIKELLWMRTLVEGMTEATREVNQRIVENLPPKSREIYDRCLSMNLIVARDFEDMSIQQASTILKELADIGLLARKPRHWCGGFEWIYQCLKVL